MRIDRLFNNGRKQNFALGRILLCRVYAKTANTNSYKNNWTVYTYSNLGIFYKL